ncbi:MAG: CHAT domain-containing protein [Saprospiraceae bacterium]
MTTLPPPFATVLTYLFLTTFTLAGQSWQSLDSLGAKNYGDRKYEEALTFATEAIESYQQQVGVEDTVYVDLLSSRAEVLGRLEMYKEQFAQYQEVIEVLNSFLGESISDYYPYSTYLLGMAQNRQRFSDYRQAQQLYQESLQIRSRIMGDSSLHAAVCINNLGVNYFYLQKIDSSIFYLKKAAAIWKRESDGPGDIRYAACIRNIGAIYNNRGKYNKALPYLQESLELTALTDSMGRDYIDALEKVGSVYERMGRYEEAETYYRKMLMKAEIFYGAKHSKLAELQGLAADLNSAMGREDKAILLRKSSLEVMGKVYGTDQPQYAIQAFKLGGLYLDFRDYERAKEWLDKARSIYEAKQDTLNPYFSSVVGDLGLYYKYTKKYQEAIPFFKRQIELLQRNNLDTSSTMAIALHNLANLYIDLMKYDEAEAAQARGIGIREHLFGAHHSSYFEDLHTLAVIDYRRKDLTAALDKFERVVAGYRERIGTSGAYNVYVRGLGSLYCSFERYQEALPFFEEYIRATQVNINRNFDVLSEAGRAKFVRSISRELTIFSSELYELYNNVPAAAGLLYDVSLLLKGLLMDSNRAFIQEITASKDASLKANYSEWLRLKRILNKRYERPLEKRAGLDSLERRLEQLDEDLTQATRVPYPFQRTTSWREVQSVLRDEEVAVEFLHFQFYRDEQWSDSIIYCALLNRKDWASPKMVPLFEEKDLETLLLRPFPSQKKKIKSLYSKRLYDLLWKPIEQLIEAPTKIYYAPAGLLHRLTFAAIPDSKGNPLMENYQLQYISSGRNLLKNRGLKPQRPTSARIYGGVDYGAGKVDGKRGVRGRKKKKRRRSRKRVTRGAGWGHLPNSLLELNRLAQLFQANAIETTTLQGLVATEESFHGMGAAGNAPHILHLATHGFSFSEEIQDENPIIDKSNYFQHAADPLLRSGLVLAGANRVWLNTDSIPENENGILTAREISNSNLQNTVLVVLSACETALGDIIGTEGVFGLQRTFRMAGADYLIATLWTISDSHHTVEFMEHFYRLWLAEEMTIHEAFHKAQSALQEKYPHPYYWAGFVLIE